MIIVSFDARSVNVSVFTTTWVRLSNTHALGHCAFFFRAIRTPLPITAPTFQIRRCPVGLWPFGFYHPQFTIFLWLIHLFRLQSLSNFLSIDSRCPSFAALALKMESHELCTFVAVWISRGFARAPRVRRHREENHGWEVDIISRRVRLPPPPKESTRTG